MTFTGRDGVKRSLIYDSYHKMITYYKGLARDFRQPVIFEIVPITSFDATLFLHKEARDSYQDPQNKRSSSDKFESLGLPSHVQGKTMGEAFESDDGPCPDDIWGYLEIKEVD